MEFIFVIIFIIVVVVKQIRKADPNGSGNPANRQAQQAGQRAAQRTAPSRTAASSSSRYSTSTNAGSFGRTNYRQVGSANITRDGRVYATLDFDNTHYHAEGFDFDCCISFKGLPPGTDELAVLIASNNRHERELAKLMKERQA